MKCAKLSEGKLKYINDFCNELDEVLEEYKNSDQREEDMDKVLRKVLECSNVTFAIQHLLTAYETIYNAACDPTLDYLDLKPELKPHE